MTRISLGVQSLVARVLADLGRRHGPGSVGRAVGLVGEAGFATYNVDVVYGSVAEQNEDLAATIDGLLALDPAPPHVSAYALTVEPGTPLAADPARHPDDDTEADRYELVDEMLGAAGLDATRSRTGPDPATSAITTSPAGRGRTTSASAVRRTATWPGTALPTSPRPSATSTGSATASRRWR